jgi:hypothetical protein
MFQFDEGVYIRLSEISSIAADFKVFTLVLTMKNSSQFQRKMKDEDTLSALTYSLVSLA